MRCVSPFGHPTERCWTQRAGVSIGRSSRSPHSPTEHLASSPEFAGPPLHRPRPAHHPPPPNGDSTVSPPSKATLPDHTTRHTAAPHPPLPPPQNIAQRRSFGYHEPHTMPQTSTVHSPSPRVAELIKAFRHTPPVTPPTILTPFRDDDGRVGPRDAATHWIHWYPAKMFHRIPAQILSSASSRPLTVLDPFCGSGTVLLEAALRGHLAIGIDVNPLARLIARVKTTRLNVDSLSARAAASLRHPSADRDTHNIDTLPTYWFLPGARQALLQAHQDIHRIPYRPHRDFLRVSLSAIVRRSSLADPSIPPPVRLSVDRSKRASTRYARDLTNALAVSPETIHDAFRKRVESNTLRMAQLLRCPRYGRARVLPTSAEAAATGLPPDSVDLIITSPPYCGSQKYVRSLKLEMLLLGFPSSTIAEADRRTLGTERLSIRNARARLTTPFLDANAFIRLVSETNLTRALMAADYIHYLSRFAVECARVLKPGGEAFVTFGTSRVAGVPAPWDRLFRTVAEHAGLRLVAVLVDRIPSRGLMTSRHRTSSTINDERIVWLKRDL